MRVSADRPGMWHLEIWFYSVILVHGLGSPSCRFTPEKIPFLCPNMLRILHPHQLGWRGLCCCDKQFCSFWVKWVLEWPLPHILSAHCLGGITFGQHWDTIPCCAELQSFTIASLCRREPGTWPLPKLLILCCGLQELLCPRPSRGASSPSHPKMQASGRRNIPLCAVAWGHEMSWEGWAGQWGGLTVRSRERCSNQEAWKRKKSWSAVTFSSGFSSAREEWVKWRYRRKKVKQSSGG